jgi:hypothetical protein
MAVAATEQIVHYEDPTTAEQPQFLIEAVPDMIEDRFTRERAGRFIGACLADEHLELQYVETVQTVRPIESLYDAITQAAEGNSEAINLIKTNVATDVIERTIKSGHVISVDLHVDEAGRIQQFGQSMESVQANSLRLASGRSEMLERTKAEATNTFRINDRYRQGMLEDYSFVVFSRAADNLSEADMRSEGFFTETMSCAIQVTTASGNRLTTESAFVAGVRSQGEVRHDAETIISVGQKLGVDFTNKSAADLINTPLLIHNSLLPNGVIDLVKLYDEAAGNTFFGEDRPAEYYEAYRQKCLERETTLQPKVESITAELVAEAAMITSRVHASERLNKISGRHMVQQAMFDDSIKPWVFGVEAAQHIIAGRIHFEQGNIEEALRQTRQAEKKEQSSPCPGGVGSRENGESTRDAAEVKGSDESGDCEFVSKECPKCHKKNVKTVVSKGKIKGSCGCSAKVK